MIIKHSSVYKSKLPNVTKWNVDPGSGKGQCKLWMFWWNQSIPSMFWWSFWIWSRHRPLQKYDFLSVLFKMLFFMKPTHIPQVRALEYLFIYSARVVFNEPNKAHVTPLFIRLHWLPIAARIKFKVLMFAYKTTTGTAPIYLNLLVQTYAPSRSLRSASERRLVVPSQRGTKSLSRTFSWTVPSWWNDLPISIRTAESISHFQKKHLKTHLFRQHLTN